MYRLVHSINRFNKYVGTTIFNRLYSNHINMHSFQNLADLLEMVRNRGHVQAKLDPLTCKYGSTQKDSIINESADVENIIINQLVEESPNFSDDTLNFWNLSNKDLDIPYMSKSNTEVTMRSVIVDTIDKYCGTCSIETSHIRSMGRRLWLRNEWEADIEPLTNDLRKKILSWLIEADQFEAFLSQQFPKAKRFGIEGAESLIIAIQSILFQANLDGINHIELGMAHRGRLNVLANVMNKPFGQIFSEFKDRQKLIDSGDVKYHLGSECLRDNMHLELSPNPSHLELIDPIITGRCKAYETYNNKLALGIIIHGDGSFSGQGIVAETFQLSRAPGFRTAWISLVVNNQIAFTTDPWRMLKTKHPTDMARGSGVPIFHVNGDDVEQVYRVCSIAARYRNRFKQSVVIDLVGYRRYGHNETDDPTIMHPTLYQKIKNHPTTLERFIETLRKRNVVEYDEIMELIDKYNKKMNDEMGNLDDYKPNMTEKVTTTWQDTILYESASRILSGVEFSTLKRITNIITTIPQTFCVHPVIKKLLKARAEMVLDKESLVDWSMAEHLAFGVLLLQDSFVRLTGQDCERGTFNQRHATIVDQSTNEYWCPLTALTKYKNQLIINNSPLIESAHLGFEFGYSLIDPTDNKSLVCWEAQFGDFANMAQAIIDTFISASSIRWNSFSNIVLLLPHGLEGNGPEHSSGRLERFLNLMNDDDSCIYGLSNEKMSEFERFFHEVSNGKDELNRDEIREALNLASNEANDLLKLVDTDRDGKMSLSEWMNFISKHYQKNSSLPANMSVVQPTTPANYFHVLLRQAHRDYKRPLVCFTPKFLLHHKKCRSAVKEFLIGTAFLPIIVDGDVSSKTSTILFCTGKIVYTLKKSLRAQKRIEKVIIIRLEQIAPFPYEEIENILLKVSQKCTKLPSLLWVQEEARNQGGWRYVEPRLKTLVEHLKLKFSPVTCISRPASGVTSVGSFHVHHAQEKQIIDEVINHIENLFKENKTASIIKS